MKKIVLFDPSYGTSNLGDLIINEAVMKHMDFLFSKHFLVRYSSHNPLLHVHQLLFNNHVTRNCNKKHLKFLGGSNIVKLHLNRPTPDWNINPLTKHLYRNSVCIGAGSEGKPGTSDFYTRSIHRSVMSKDFIHSTRDEVTKQFLEQLGFKATNTGCPTTWDLTKDHCRQIPTTKAKDVVFTLTDYLADHEQDESLINTLLNNYETVYFWPQGVRDLEYFKTLKDSKKINVLGANLNSYRAALQKGNIDYVGTRLHAGIYAMQYKIRSIILIVDNRARDMQESYNINTVEREKIDDLQDMLNSSFSTQVNIDEEKISKWKKQFINY